MISIIKKYRYYLGGKDLSQVRVVYVLIIGQPVQNRTFLINFYSAFYNAGLHCRAFFFTIYYKMIYSPVQKLSLKYRVETANRLDFFSACRKTEFFQVNR